jgi:hypothetical protein
LFHIRQATIRPNVPINFDRYAQLPDIRRRLGERLK